MGIEAQGRMVEQVDLDKHNAANSNNETMMTMMTMIIVRVTMAMGMVTVMMFINMMLEIVLIYLVKLADHGE